MTKLSNLYSDTSIPLYFQTSLETQCITDTWLWKIWSSWDAFSGLIGECDFNKYYVFLDQHLCWSWINNPIRFEGHVYSLCQV